MTVCFSLLPWINMGSWYLIIPYFSESVNLKSDTLSPWLLWDCLSVQYNTQWTCASAVGGLMLCRWNNCLRTSNISGKSAEDQQNIKKVKKSLSFTFFFFFVHWFDLFQNNRTLLLNNINLLKKRTENTVWNVLFSASLSAHPYWHST